MAYLPRLFGTRSMARRGQAVPPVVVVMAAEEYERLEAWRRRNIRLGRRKVGEVKALLYYALKWLGLDIDPAAHRPADQQLIRLDRETALGDVPGSIIIMDGHQ